MRWLAHRVDTEHYFDLHHTAADTLWTFDPFWAGQIHPDHRAAGQAALLAAALPDPAHIRPDAPGPYTRERAAEILRGMRLPDGPFYLRGL